MERGRGWLRAIAVAVVLLPGLFAEGQRGPDETRVWQALRGTGAVAVVLEQGSGLVVAYTADGKHGAIRALPGSAIKPFVLAYALEHGLVQAETTVYCRRSLVVAGRSLPCTHPAANPVMDAETALAESCNTWFAALGRRMPAGEIDRALRGAGFAEAPATGMDEAARELTVLGVSGVEVSPEVLAENFRRLVKRLPPDGVVARGLRGSVRFGMASPARVDGVEILGKTGTAKEPGTAATHGWFEGAFVGRWVIVVYVPRGDGGVAAAVGRRVFLALRGAGR